MMQVIKYPKVSALAGLLQRPQPQNRRLQTQVKTILETVRKNGDDAIRQYTRQFDGVSLGRLAVLPTEIQAAAKDLSPQLKKAIQAAHKNIAAFHKAQMPNAVQVETMPGVTCIQKPVPIQQVGLYVPGGSAPLFSTVLMLSIPAQLAGCPRIVLCSPPGANEQIHPAVLYAAHLCGVTEVYKIGGAQAIAAMAYGTATIKPVHKLFGPGNSYVTEAKLQVQKQGLAIDMPAGPSEVMVVADNTAHPDFVAADLLSQAEHGPDSQVVLVTTSHSLIEKVVQQVKLQLKQLPRRAVAAKALKHSKILLVNNKQEAVAAVNTYAPEHLILATGNEDYYVKNIHHAGSVFIGHYTPESAGDYASGTNHTLPTHGYAKAYSGVSLLSFFKFITYQKIEERGLINIGPVVETLAEAEGLQAHKNAVTIRLNKLKQL